ncbi:uncharacterized protein LOC122721104 isoform X1 [Apis laboriosa]|uniref:uncharacterized protein LOC122721104 isoform X1 n=1 Tax=Apis laboriosa TaxID=183418 RepID=UPI001CC74759|nr:uncharacterized protein LOC122721104 isoform X1 [Apis laboriosa]
MLNLSARKAKSLNNISEVFKKDDYAESEVSSLFDENIVKEHFKKLNQAKKDVFLSLRIDLQSKDIEQSEDSNISDMDERNEEKELQKLKESKVNEDDRVKSDSKIDLVDRKLKKKKRILSVIDVFLSLNFITPMTIGFWRGTWTLMDIYKDKFPGLFIFFMGLLVHINFAIMKNFIHTCIIKIWKKKTWLSKIYCKSLQILYTYIFGIACNMHWKGSWIIFDYFFLNHIWLIVGVITLIMISLMILRSFRNILAPPVMIAVDKLIFVFYFPTRYKLNTRDWSLYLLDCAFSVGVVGTLVVFVWRGVWILFDLYLFPDNHEYSAIGSLAIGYVIVTMTFSLQPLMRYACARLQGLARLIVADCFLLLSFLGTVNVWRGIWNVLDLWLVPDNPEMSCWITHVGCFVFLVLLNCSNSILVRGVYIDAEEDDGKCVVFPCHYLRLFFKIEREKKEARRQNLLVASKDFRPRPDGNPKDTENGALLPNSTATTILPTNPESLV